MLQDGDSFEQIVGPVIEAGPLLAVAVLGDGGPAEDSVQEAALTARRRPPTPRDRSALRPWFQAIVANQWVGRR